MVLAAAHASTVATGKGRKDCCILAASLIAVQCVLPTSNELCHLQVYRTSLAQGAFLDLNFLGWKLEKASCLRSGDKLHFGNNDLVGGWGCL